MMKSKNRQNQVRVRGSQVAAKTINPNTSQFTQLLDLGETDLSSVLGTTVTDMFDLYANVRVKKIKCEVYLNTPSTAGLCPPAFIHFAPGPGAFVVPTALTDIESTCVSNVANGFTWNNTATQALCLFTHPGQHCALSVTQSDFAENVPGQWYSCNADTGQIINLGKFYYCYLSSGGSNQNQTLFVRFFFDLEFKVLRDVAVLRQLFIKAPAATTSKKQTVLSQLRELLDSPDGASCT